MSHQHSNDDNPFSANSSIIERLMLQYNNARAKATNTRSLEVKNATSKLTCESTFLQKGIATYEKEIADARLSLALSESEVCVRILPHELRAHY